MTKSATIKNLRAAIADIESSNAAALKNRSGNGGLAHGGYGPANSTRSEQAPSDATSAGDSSHARPESSSNDDSEAANAFKKIIAYVNVADKSERAIRQKLERAGFQQAAVEEAVTRALKCGYIDDERYARVLIRSRVSQGKGSRGIERELAENGIEAQLIEGWPYEFELDYDSELERARLVLCKKPPRSKNPRDGAYRKLVQKGYPSSVAASAARLWHESI